MERPSMRESKALKELNDEKWKEAASLYPLGPASIADMERKGWIETQGSSGKLQVRITDLGLVMSEIPPSRRRNDGPKIPMQKSRIPMSEGLAGRLRGKK